MSDPLFRIIDANFNRAREALRGMEEFCRFVLDDKTFTAQLKQYRHQLTDAIQRLDRAKLLTSRDSHQDVGKGLAVACQMSRSSLQDTFIAAAKRASEALRVLAETTQWLDPSISAECERLRFGVYALEKEVFLAATKKEKLDRMALYVLINVSADTPSDKMLSFAAQCLDGGADALQLRAKNIPDAQFLQLANLFVSLCNQYNALSIINDRIDIAVLSQAEGVHLGQSDLSVQDAHCLQKKPLLVGGSTHNPSELQAAIQSRYDYVGVGPAFPSPTKPDIPTAGLDYLRFAASQLQHTSVKPIAIGGINPENVSEILKTGIRAIAVSSSVLEKPAQTCKLLKSILSAF